LSQSSSQFGLLSQWDRTVIAIEPTEYQTLVRAKDCLMACIGLEEAYDVVILNYVSFETAMVATVVGNFVERGIDRPDREAARREIDRQLVNLLAAGEMYGEHARASIKGVFGRLSGQEGQLAAAFEDQQRRFLGFRAVEKLRNAVLHHALPVSSWTSGGRWIDRNGEQLAVLQHSYSVAFDPRMLARGRGADPSLARALESRAEKNGKVAWVPIIREYVEALSYLHDQVRQLLDNRERQAVELLEGAQGRVEAVAPNSDMPCVVAAAEFDSSGSVVGEISLTFDYREQIAPLRAKNRPLVNLHKREILG
jgi:hypothetical protein